MSLLSSRGNGIGCSRQDAVSGAYQPGRYSKVDSVKLDESERFTFSGARPDSLIFIGFDWIIR